MTLRLRLHRFPSRERESAFRHRGEHDPTDACPQTASGAPVDAAGCSLAQFCAAIPVVSDQDRAVCKFSDWNGDEPVGNAADCKIAGDVLSRHPVALHCVPR